MKVTLSIFMSVFSTFLIQAFQFISLLVGVLRGNLKQ